jgi:nucleoside-diphosphate-sugar epimerase
MKLTALITGGAGFIGSNLARFLKEKNFNVYIIDDLSTGNLENIKDINVNFIHSDIRNINKINNLPYFDVIFHLAASVGRQKSIKNPYLDTEINIIGTLSLLEYIVKNKVSKIIYSSSAAIYGELVEDYISEDHPLNPDSPYGVSKLAAEKMINCFSSMYRFKAVSLRYFNIYGTNQRFDLYGNVIPIFVHNILNQKSINVFGDGEQTRDFLNVEDVVKANYLSAINNLEGVFNLGSSSTISINKLIEKLETIHKKIIHVNYLPKRIGDVLNCKADISRINNALNFFPEVNLDSGLSSYYHWYKGIINK